jgi:twinkle protein
MDEGEFIRHEECPHCGSSDANALYSTGKHYCFSCQVMTYPDDNKGVIAVTTQKSNFAFLPIEVQALNKRKITEKTARHWQYGVSTYKGKKVQVANYYDREGTLQAQKIRFPNKDFLALGDMKKVGLYGEHLCRDGW